MVYSVRKGKLPRSFIGCKIDQALLKKMEKRNVDAAGEKSEYQSFVTNSPIMKGEIVIDSFSTHYVLGRGTVPDKGKKDHFFRMFLKDFHVEHKR